MNEILRDASLVRLSGKIVDHLGLIRNTSPFGDYKNWDLVHVLTSLGDGNLLDMGVRDSWVLANSVRMGVKGEKWGLDVKEVKQSQRVPGCNYKITSLCNTGFRSGHFQTVTCLSVLEHAVDHIQFVSESSRILKKGGKLMTTFDYWPDRYPVYSNGWRLLCREDAENLIVIARQHGLHLNGPMNWECEKPVLWTHWIIPGTPKRPYTFAYMEFIKQ